MDSEPGEEEAPSYEPSQETRDRKWVAEEISAGTRGVAAEDVPSSLCRVAARLVPVTGASVSVTGSLEGETSVTLCSSDPVAARLAEIQYTLGDGPSRQAVRWHAPVFATDVTRGPDTHRWPVYTQQAAEAGAGAVFALPLGPSPQGLGTLDLYRTTPGMLDERELRLALLTADAVGLAVLGMSDGSAQVGDRGVPWLERAEGNHEGVHQAVGMIMVQLDVGAEQALATLRARAFAEGRTATEVAKDVLARQTDFKSR